VEDKKIMNNVPIVIIVLLFKDVAGDRKGKTHLLNHRRLGETGFCPGFDMEVSLKAKESQGKAHWKAWLPYPPGG
jgi:hypothetical protein